MKIIKIIILILLLVVLGYILFPKNVGFIEKMRLSTGEEVVTLGQYDQCFGITLFEKKGNKTIYRCIGIPYGKITI
jgi:hypothetical protein